MICQNIKTFPHCLNYRHFACHMLTFANFNQGSFRNFLLILHCEKLRFMKQPIKWFVGTYRIINNISIVSAHSSSQNLLTSGVIFSFSFFFSSFIFVAITVTETTLNETRLLSLISVAQSWFFEETLRNITINNNSSVENVF